ncbi:MAG: hypothetical protein IJM81_05065 [Prevotella sp.]|nr:hypothetical protein [Prevotella sp.]
MMQRKFFSLILVLWLLSVQAVTPTGKNWRVVLPASQWTPAERWTAQTMIFNNGDRYADGFYNKVIGTPPVDAAGHEWFEPDYELTSGDVEWSEQMSPFSSDESYKGYSSTRWVLSDIMADIYLRRTFTVDKGFGGDVYLSCGHDDGPAEFYINGVLVKTVSDGWNNDEIIRLLPEQRDLIKTDGSENIIAVHVHQNWGGAFADCGIYEDLTGNTVALLPTLTEVEKWECAYYTLNSNDELTGLDPKLWAGRCVDESDWAFGYGPFSNSRDHFLVSEWASSIQPLLVRRHFTLTAEQVEEFQSRKMTISCSYDENPKVYLNGTLLRSWSGWNDNNYESYTLTTRQKALLREGDNVLAVSLQQGGGSGHIDYGISIVLPYVEPTGINILDERLRMKGESNNPSSLTPHPSSTYDLQGRPIVPSTGNSSTHHGIIIKKGKKIITK